MNPAIEYLLRDDKSKQLLKFPCSLFLEKDDGNKLIITIEKINDNFYKIDHWRLWEVHDKFPVFTEFKINVEDIFVNPCVILKNCTLLEYEEDLYQSGKTQSTDIITGMQQQMEYEAKYNNLYNSLKHRANKHTWLWKAFINHLPEKILNNPFAYNTNMLKEILQNHHKSWWFAWKRWIRFFIDNNHVASELIFKPYFPEKKKEYYLTSFISF